MRLAATAALALVAGCSNLPADLPTCGNGVIDPGEDCDVPDPPPSSLCVACRLQCADTDTPCPDNYRCGVDRLCHAPSGVFHETGTFPFATLGVTVTDIDRDGFPDFVGINSDTAVVRYGDADGLLTRSSTTVLPTATGPAFFADVDGDGATDVAIPAFQGLTALTSPAKLLLPFPYANNPGSRASCASRNGLAKPLAVFALDDRHIGEVIADNSSPNTIYVGVLDVQTESCTHVAACTLTDNGSPIAIDHYTTTKITGGVLTALVTVATATEVCVMSVNQTSSPPLPTPPTFAIAQVGTTYSWQQPTGVQPNARPVLAQIDTATSCPALVVTTPAVSAYLGGPVTPNAPCTLAASATPLPLPATAANLVPAARVRVLPVVTDPMTATAAGPDLIVMSTNDTPYPAGSLWAYANPNWTEVYQATHPIDSVASGDLDGDKIDEVVVSSRFSSDIEILYRVQNPDGFLEDKVPIAGTPGNVVIRDFDGNGLGDIAYLDELPGNEQLEIAYGTPDRPLPPVPIASFANTRALMFPVNATPVPNGPMDLIVLQPNPQGILLTILFGNAQRTMYAYFDPRPNTQLAPSEGFQAVLAGQLNLPGSQGMGADILGFEWSGTTMTGATQIWEMPSAGQGALQSPPRALATPPNAFDSPGCSLNGGFCFQSSHFVAFPLAGREVPIGIDSALRVVTIDPQLATTTDQPITMKPLPLQSPVKDVVVLRLSAEQLDATPDPALAASKLIVPLRPAQPFTPGGGLTQVCDVDPSGVLGACTDLRDLVGGPSGPLANLTCIDAQPGIATARGVLTTGAPASAQHDLAAVCTDGAAGSAIYIIARDATGFHATQLPQIVPNGSTGPAGFIELADVTGDGVDDLMVLSADQPGNVPTIHVWVQCDAHDLACQGTP